QAATAVAQSGEERRLLPLECRRAGRARARRPAQAPHGRGRRRRHGRIELMSDTFFSGAPHWTWFIIVYFFVGGIAGGACFLAVLSALGGMAEEGRLRNPALRAVGGAVRGGSGLAKVVGGVAGLLGIFIAGYTGVLLSVTNRPIWADSPWLGALFIASGASTGAAALI